jgi:uncharacterized protein YegJ (DUF2314 family)
LVLEFGFRAADVWDSLLAATTVSETVARDTGGLLWDEETREVFTPDEWHKRRITTWAGGVPDISDHITIHAYNSGEYVRAITLGMRKVGLPDVVVEESSWSSDGSVGHLINLFCQAMAEGATIDRPGEFDLDLRAIRNDAVRNPQVESLKSNATGKALLSLRRGKWEDGDPMNRLIEIGFDRYPGRDHHARREAMLSSLFGWKDSSEPVKHDERLLAASRRAKERLPALCKDFSEGLAPAEFIQLKAPFATPDGGREWMWVEVTAWKAGKIRGILKNEPFSIPDLHAGQVVEVSQEDVFDYIRTYPDGREEGNETGAVIGKMQEENKQ